MSKMIVLSTIGFGSIAIGLDGRTTANVEIGIPRLRVRRVLTTLWIAAATGAWVVEIY